VRPLQFQNNKNFAEVRNLLVSREKALNAERGINENYCDQNISIERQLRRGCKMRTQAARETLLRYVVKLEADLFFRSREFCTDLERKHTNNIKGLRARGCGGWWRRQQQLQFYCLARRE
jgi:hypothetical protein